MGALPCQGGGPPQEDEKGWEEGPAHECADESPAVRPSLRLSTRERLISSKSIGSPPSVSAGQMWPRLLCPHRRQRYSFRSLPVSEVRFTRPTCAFSMRFHRLRTAFPVRPGRCDAILHHFLPCCSTRSRMRRSSCTVHIGASFLVDSLRPMLPIRSAGCGSSMSGSSSSCRGEPGPKLGGMPRTMPGCCWPYNVSSFSWHCWPGGEPEDGQKSSELPERPSCSRSGSQSSRSGS
mmetsp:Transcript_21349/g.70572  ORF Transcript_21349/g.70572 Transcript_21349/m.70572 type:complete len:235 (+) Transcript_21349:713-1417(+)